MHRIYQLAPIIFVLVAPAPIPAQQTLPSLAITHVTVIDCTDAPAQPDMTVVISGDRITGLGKTGATESPADAIIIDASGKFMIPGLWDMHVHTNSRTAGLFLANGVLGMRVMWGKPAHLTDREREGELGNRYDGADNPSFSGTLFSGVQLEGTPSLPFLRSSVASSIIDGPEPIWPGSLAIHSEDQARQVVRNFKMQGYDFLKVYSRLSRNVYLAIADEANQVGIPFAGHIPYAISAAEASDVGQATIEHLHGIYMGCSSAEKELREQAAKKKFLYPVGLQEARATYDPNKAETLFRRFAKNETWQVPTLTNLRWRAFADSTKLTQDERMRYISPIQARGWRDRAQRMASPSGLDLAMLRRNFEQDLRIVGQMHDCGVRMMAGTDTANPFCLPGFGLHDELELLVLAGLSPMQALQAATQGPAEYLGRLKDLGTVERGKLADLVLLDADPLGDINNVRKISSVVFNGNYFAREQLDEILAERELEHSIVELAESFSQERLQSLAGNELIHHVRRLRIQDAVYRMIEIRMHPQLGEEKGEDATKLFRYMPELEKLFFSNTNFNDLGLSRLRTLTNLKVLEIGATQVTDEGLVHIEQLTALQSLNLSDTKVTDTGLQRMAKLSRLKQLNLSGTSISDSGLDPLLSNNQLEELKLNRTRLGVDSLRRIASFNGLNSLHLAGTLVADEGLKELVALQTLSELSLADTDITDAGLKQLHQLKSLTSLDLTNTTVSLEGVEEFKRALPHCAITISTTPRLTVKLVHPARDAFIENGATVMLKALTRATIGTEVGRVEFLADGDIVALKNDPPYEAVWKGASRGRHDLKVQVFDKNGTQKGAHSTSIFVGVHGVKRTINFPADDAEEQEDGSISLDSSELRLAHSEAVGDQVIGMRFTTITIPKDARITKAYLQFMAREAGEERTDLEIRAELSPNAPAYSNVKHNLSSRPTTDAPVTWSPEPWTRPFERTEKQKTPDLSILIQAVVSQHDWKSGNALGFVIRGTGQRTAVAAGGKGAPPLLHIEYEP